MEVEVAEVDPHPPQDPQLEQLPQDLLLDPQHKLPPQLNLLDQELEVLWLKELPWEPVWLSEVLSQTQ